MNMGMVGIIIVDCFVLLHDDHLITESVNCTGILICLSYLVHSAFLAIK
jgi:hypothetical protein